MAYPQSFKEFLGTLKSLGDGGAKARLIDDFLSRHAVPIVEDNRVTFLYRGQGRVVAVPGELNRWTPSRAHMEHVEGTDLFYHTDSVPMNARVEYKIWVDSTWMLDPLNQRRAMGGFGENSDLRMPGYRPTSIDQENSGIPRGKIDTLWLESRFLRRTHPVFVYTPAEKSPGRLPVIYVTDGGEYLSIGKMNIVLDNLISAGRIRPVVGVFVDPRTDLHDPSGNMRLSEYSPNAAYLDFLEKEVAPLIERSYGVTDDSGGRVILGASMGGLIATFAALSRPHFVLNYAAQSPSYLQAGGSLVRLLDSLRTTSVNAYIQTGTINDTEIEARLVRKMLQERGARICYEEFPEGHNWTNWRSRLSGILEYFFSR